MTAVAEPPQILLGIEAARLEEHSGLPSSEQRQPPEVRPVHDTQEPPNVEEFAPTPL
jgi:hypothetical protein